MGTIDDLYIRGVSQALNDTGICKIANMDAIVSMATRAIKNSYVKTANDPATAGGTPPVEPTPEELAQVGDSGLTEGDIQSAAKVVQVLAEMKQKADMAVQAQAQAVPGAMGAGGAPAPAGGAVPGSVAPVQPPLPPPPQGAAGGLAGGGGMPGISGMA